MFPVGKSSPEQLKSHFLLLLCGLEESFNSLKTAKTVACWSLFSLWVTHGREDLFHLLPGSQV